MDGCNKDDRFTTYSKYTVNYFMILPYTPWFCQQNGMNGAYTEIAQWLVEVEHVNECAHVMIRSQMMMPGAWEIILEWIQYHVTLNHVKDQVSIYILMLLL